TLRSQCAASSAFFGPSSKCNVAERVPGAQTNPRAELFGFLLALKMTPMHRLLVIHTRSTLAIRAVVHLSPMQKECGWICMNADGTSSRTSMISYVPIQLLSSLY
ncbi:hypothetical protein ARMSODRAFT_888047, partial [Armillaria solidipes]